MLMFIARRLQINEYNTKYETFNIILSHTAEPKHYDQSQVK